MTDWTAVETLCRVTDPLDWTPAKSTAMVNACREMARFHQQNCDPIAHVYRRHDFDPESLQVEADLARIPVVGVQAMKHHLLTSRPHEAAVLKLTSSGTRGQKTQIWFDQPSLDRVQAMMSTLWTHEGLVSDQPTEYVMFSYSPDDAKDLGIAFSNSNLQRFAPVARSHYAIRKDPDGTWTFDVAATLAHLTEIARGDRPARLFGMPGFIWELLEQMKVGQRLQLPEGSLMVTGGGWKAAEDKQVSRIQFRRMVVDCFGIPQERVRDNYGMAEHCAPYIQCRLHQFHVPVFNRVLARDPISMAVLPPGQSGLLELVTPYNAMMPNLALLSTDVGQLDPEPCGCGRTAPTFTLQGRGGLSKAKGCAITAGEMVARSRAPR